MAVEAEREAVVEGSLEMVMLAGVQEDMVGKAEMADVEEVGVEEVEGEHMAAPEDQEMAAPTPRQAQQDCYSATGRLMVYQKERRSRGGAARDCSRFWQLEGMRGSSQTCCNH